MKLEWIGNYRDIIGELYRSANAFSVTCKKDTVGDKVKFSSYEIQIMEHIIEYENQNMKWYANKLGLSPSTYTKTVQKMVDKGLLEKYHIAGNKKDIILKLSALGEEEYKKYAESTGNAFLKPLVEKLDSYSEETRAAIKEFLKLWGDYCYNLLQSDEKSDIKLIKIDKK